MIRPAIIILIIWIVTFPLLSSEDPLLHLKSGIEAYKHYRFDTAREEYEKALSLYFSSGDLNGAGECYLSLGEVYFSLCLYENSLTSYGNACDTFRKLSKKDREAFSLINKSQVYLNLRLYEESLKSCKGAMSLYEEISDKKGMAASLSHTGDIYSELGLYSESLKCYTDSLSMFIELNDIENIGLLLCKTGEDYIKSGDKETGLQKLQEALNIAKSSPSISYELLMRTGDICQEYGYYEEGLSKYREARKVVKDMGDTVREYKALREIARTSLLKGDDEGSLGIYDRVMVIAKEAGDKGGRIDGLFNVALLYDKHGRTDDSIKAYKECLDFYKSAGNPFGTVKTLQNLGSIYEKTGQAAMAEECYRGAIEELEKIRGEIRLEEFKESFSEKFMPYYRHIINFLIEEGKYKEAFYYLEMARARSLLDAITGARVDIKKGVKPELLEKDKKLQGEMNYLQSALIREHSRVKPDEEYVRELQGKLLKTREEFKSLQQELLLSNPSYSFLTGIKKPLTPDEIQQKVLTENQFILEYFIKNDKLDVWVISKKSFSFVEIPVPSDELNKKIEDFRKPFEELKGKESVFIDILSKCDDRNLAELYSLIFKPVLEKVSIPDNAELFIVPDGILYYLPFEALITEKGKESDRQITFSGFSANKYVIEKYSISYIPSATLLDPSLRERKEKPGGTFLGFGNPDFTVIPDVRIIPGMNNFIRLQGRENYYFPPLPGTEKEVKNICDLFRKSGKTEIYTGINATEENVKSKSSDYRYLLFATHGFLDEENPMYSGLVFTLKGTKDEDGFLRAMEVLNLNLKSELVVLSACETGLGKIRTGEGVIGLTRAFMYAGSHAVVVSLWSVESASTARLMEIFYKNLMAGMTKAEALRKAKITLMKETEVIEGNRLSYSHPFFWAPFVMVGK
ncbi:MAG: CHAT domain-containing protein [Candidatus Eremiobacterota bacterium]